MSDSSDDSRSRRSTGGRESDDQRRELERDIRDAIAGLRELGRTRGYVSPAEVDAAAEDAGLTEHASRMRQMLRARGISVQDDGDLDRSGTVGDPVRLYLNEIGRVPLLSASEEIDLAKRMWAGWSAAEILDSDEEIDPDRRRDLRKVEADGKKAQSQLTQANLRLVVSIAKRYGGSNLGLPDLIQEGNLGLMRAVEKFDPTRGYKFSTYATWWIRQMINRSMADQSRTIRLPVHIVEQIAKIRRTRRQLLQKFGREATDEEVAAEVELDVDRLVELEALTVDPTSLDAPVGEDGADFAEIIEDPHAVSPFEAAASMLLAAHLNRVLDSLPERERHVVVNRFGLLDGEPQTLEQVGQGLGLTRERIRQIEARALSRLREPQSMTELEGFLQS